MARRGRRGHGNGAESGRTDLLERRHPCIPRDADPAPARRRGPHLGRAFDDTLTSAGGSPPLWILPALRSGAAERLQQIADQLASRAVSQLDALLQRLHANAGVRGATLPGDVTP